MNDELAQKFNSGNFSQESAILKVMYCNSKDIAIQHLLVKEKVKKIEVNRLRKRYFIDTVTSVDIKETIGTRGKLIKIYEGVVYGEQFKVHPLGTNTEKFNNLTIKYKKKTTV